MPNRWRSCLEIASCYPVELLRTGLFEKSEKIVHRQNGNRSVTGAVFLKRLEKIFPKVGITRVADISHLSFNHYPVFQAVRPRLHYHWSTGQNSGAQGKGPTVIQAKISAIMESIESYCAEPRNAHLIRGSYNFLKKQHYLINPKSFLQRLGIEPVRLQEPLMWVRALHFHSRKEVLIPAETVFFPFSTLDYDTRSVFSSGSNGLSSGATYKEAVVHGLYEVIERYYEACLDFEEKKMQIEALFEDDYRRIHLVRDNLDEGWEIELYAYFFPSGPNIPTVMCALYERDKPVGQGWGCCFNVDIAIDRAISEAFQAIATRRSGSREDMARKRGSANKKSYEIEYPKVRSLDIDQFKKKAQHKDYESLDYELKDILKWLSAMGYRDICIANLTRSGIDIPVVKVVIPELICPNEFLRPTSFQSESAIRKSFVY